MKNTILKNATCMYITFLTRVIKEIFIKKIFKPKLLHFEQGSFRKKWLWVELLAIEFLTIEILIVELLFESGGIFDCEYIHTHTLMYFVDFKA